MTSENSIENMSDSLIPNLFKINERIKMSITQAFQSFKYNHFYKNLVGYALLIPPKQNQVITSKTARRP